MKATTEQIIVDTISDMVMPILRDGQYVAEQWHLHLTCLASPGERRTLDYPGSPPVVEVIGVMLRPEGDPEWKKLDDPHAYTNWISLDDARKLVLEQVAKRSIR